MRQEIFVVLLSAVCGFAFWRGGAPERILGAVLLIGTASSVLLVTPHKHFFHEEYGVFVIDVFALAVFTTVAILSTRWSPIFVAGLQLDGVLVHLIHLVAPNVIPIAYLNATALWSYPMLAILAVGTWRHRQRLKRWGTDPAWKRASHIPARRVLRVELES
jgi:hypothetical protein